MENDMLALWSGFGAVLFILLFFLLQKNASYKRVHQQLHELQEEHTFLQEQHHALEQQLHNLQLQHAILNTRYEDEIHTSKEKLEILQNAKDELSREFQHLSQKIFDKKAQEFTHASQTQLELLLQPFREQIQNFSKEAKEQFEIELKERHLLTHELKTLKTMNQQLAQEALNLTKALKGENKTQGNWGEIVLAKILEQSGLREGVEYELQATRKSEDGKVYRPDVIIHLPQNRDIVVDSKVSLNAYERFVNVEDPREKKEALDAHIASISRHIKELSTKHYERLEGVNTLDFVLLFMPIEGAFLLALEHNGEFFKDAYEQNILVVSPGTLLVTLRTIEHIWRVQRQEENAKKIAKEAEAMYDKLVGFVEEMENLKKSLTKANDAYALAMNRLATGRGNLIKRAKNMKELGIKPKKEFSNQLQRIDNED